MQYIRSLSLSLSIDIKEINICNKNLSILPDLSIYTCLRKLECSGNKITQLNNLPYSLEELNCSNNQITQLNNLPSSLQKLDCPCNQLKQLDNFPPSLQMLYCNDNQITQLSNLPSSLLKLYCPYNQLSQLDNLPPSLKILHCNYNQITQLDNLPLSLRFLGCSGNKLENNNLEYWKEQTKNKKLKLLKEKICIRKIQRQWRKYWYDFYKYEIINGKNIGFCRLIEKSYIYYNQ